MELLKENRNLVIIVALLVIAYLLWDVEVVRNIRNTVTNQCSNMGNLAKVVVVVVLAYLVYCYLTRREY